jgi:hypothetical protein
MEYLFLISIIFLFILADIVYNIPIAFFITMINDSIRQGEMTVEFAKLLVWDLLCCHIYLLFK